MPLFSYRSGNERDDAATRSVRDFERNARPRRRKDQSKCMRDEGADVIADDDPGARRRRARPDMPHRERSIVRGNADRRAHAPRAVHAACKECPVDAPPQNQEDDDETGSTPHGAAFGADRAQALQAAAGTCRMKKAPRFLAVPSPSLPRKRVLSFNVPSLHGAIKLNTGSERGAVPADIQRGLVERTKN
jgi:hypothetical protein